MPEPPIGPYPRVPLAVRPPDPGTDAVARRVARLVAERSPGLVVEHFGSTAVPGLPGKGAVDLGVHPSSPAEVSAIAELLLELGFQPQDNPNPFPATRPLVLGGLAPGDGDELSRQIHLHVIADPAEWSRHLVFRDALRADPTLAGAYAALKNEIVDAGITSGLRYSMAKTAFIRRVLGDHAAAEPPIAVGATIGILGGGQLGRMLGSAARALGYRVAILDPDPDCPARSIADRQVQAPYDDIEAAIELARDCAVVTYELEHVSAAVVDAVEERLPVRPGGFALRTTQHRLAERRFLESIDAPTAPWREVRSRSDLEAGARALGFPLRLKAGLGGYDGRSQVRIADPDGPHGLESAWTELANVAERFGLLLESELDFAGEFSVVVSRDLAGRAVTFPPSANRHDRGILVESVAPAPAPVLGAVAHEATELAIRIAMELDVVGTLTVELFLLRDGSIVVNELAPRVHNSGHWTIEGAATSQFEQHIRAICGLPLGSAEAHGPTATVNLLGSGPAREALLVGPESAMADPLVHLHVYDKRQVFERRKMGHLTVAGAATPDEALARARAALNQLRWA
ncbi:MAG: 5-(carboxyamino)imidazole ribonucleotide synthase [Chloroflexota bacterium]